MLNFLGNISVEAYALILFLIVNLLVGLFFSRQVRTLKEYALAGRSLGLGVLVMTLMATILGAESFGIQTSYIRGVISLLAPFCLSAVAAILGTQVLPKVRAFKEHYSVGQIMGTIYGRWAILPTLCFTTLFSLLFIISQQIAVSALGSHLGISPNQMIYLFGLLMVAYTLVGGVRAVAMTDVLQFGLLALGVIALSFYAIRDAGGVREILKHTPTEHFLFWDHPHFFLGFCFSCLYAIWPNLLISPPIIQRVLMARTKRETQQMFLGFSLFYPMMRTLLLFTGWSLYKLTADGTVGEIHTKISKPLFILTYICRDRALLKFLFLMALCAVAMSTMDSFLNATAVAVVNDLRLLFPAQLGEKEGKPLLSLTTTLRITTLVLGLFCSLGATWLIRFRAIEFITYGCMLLSFVTFPLLIGVMGLKGSSRALLVKWATLAVCGLLFFLTGIGVPQVKFLFLSKAESLFKSISAFNWMIAIVAWCITILFSCFTFLLTHYGEYGGFVWVDREKQFFQERKVGLFNMGGFEQLRLPLSWASHWVRRHGRRLYLFGIFIYISSLFIPLTLDLTAVRMAPLLVLYGGSLFLVTLLLLESLWPLWLKRYLNLYYLGTIFYSVPLVGWLTAFYDHKGAFSAMHLVLSMILLISLVDWRRFLVMEFLALGVTLLFWRVSHGSFMPPFDVDHKLLLHLGGRVRFCGLYALCPAAGG